MVADSLKVTCWHSKEAGMTSSWIEFSAAKFEYSMYAYGEEGQKIIEYANSQCTKTEEDLEMEKAIAEAKTPEELLKLMRKGMSGTNRSALREKIVEHEQELMSMVKEKCIRNKQDIFIENAVHFFMKSKCNCCDWIIETYSQFQSEYLKSLFCLILGFRGEKSLIPFLIKEAKRLEREYPDETYDQGPVLAVQELANYYLEQ